MDVFFIKAIQEAFADAAADFTATGLPPIAHIDKFRGQPLNPELFEGFGLPAIFYSLKCRWNKIGKSYQGEMTCEFHVVQDATWETSNISTNQDVGLNQIRFLGIVRSVLDNVTSENTGKLTRGEDTPVDSGVTIYDLLNYTGSYNDPLVVTKQKMVMATPQDLSMNGELVTNVS